MRSSSGRGREEGSYTVKSVCIVPNLKKAGARETALALVAELLERGMRTGIAADEARELGRGDLSAREENLQECDLVIVLGGDGTMLRAARLLKGVEIPILGVNLGKFGFLAEIERGELSGALDLLVDGRFSVERRMMLEAEVIRAGEVVGSALSLNEVAVERGDAHRILELDVSINGSLFNTYAADGLVVATPTGSSAYSLSAGGPIVNPTLELILMTPCCPHALFDRTVVLEGGDEVSISAADPEKRKVTVTSDGRIVLRHEPLDAIKIRRASSHVLLARVAGRDFYSVLRQKLKVWDLFNR